MKRSLSEPGDLIKKKKTEKQPENEELAFIKKKGVKSLCMIKTNEIDIFPKFSVKELNSSLITPTGSTPGLCDGSLITRTRSFIALDKANEIIEERSKTRNGDTELVFAREAVKKLDWLLKPTPTKIPPNVVGREFVVVSLGGFENVLDGIIKNHNPNDPKRSFRRLACFHETFTEGQCSYKAYMDLEYDTTKISPDKWGALDDTSKSFEYVEGLFREYIPIIINRLNKYWTEIIEPKLQSPGGQLRFVTFESSRRPLPEHPDVWKISYHLIWYPESIRFEDQDSIMHFILEALTYSSEPTKDVLNDFKINDQYIIDMAVYNKHRFFRAPYNCKMSAEENENFCPLLLPVKEFCDETTASLIPQSRETFSRKLFRIGLITYNSPEENVDKVLGYLSNGKRKYVAPGKLFVEGFKQFLDFDENLYKEAMAPLHKKNPSSSEEPEVDSSDLMVKINKTLSFREHMNLIEDELGKVVSTTCTALTGGLYGKSSIGLLRWGFKSVNGNEVVFFRCRNNNPNSKYPCLARFHDRFSPHGCNNNYIILNICTLKWRMGCHNHQCINCYLAKMGKEPMTAQQIEDSGIKAKSELYSIDRKYPKLFVALSAMCNRIKEIQLYKAARSNAAKINPPAESTKEDEEEPKDVIVKDQATLDDIVTELVGEE